VTVPAGVNIPASIHADRRALLSLSGSIWACSNPDSFSRAGLTRREDGYQLTRKIRSMKPEQGGDIPAVALTAYATAEDKTRALDSGFQMHVAKPVDPTEIIFVIAKLAPRARVV